MCPQQKVAQVHKLAVGRVLDIDDPPPVLAGTHLLAIDNDGLFRADDGKRDEVLLGWLAGTGMYTLHKGKNGGDIR